MKNEIMSCVYKNKASYQTFRPPAPGTRLGLEVQHHAALGFPRDHAPAGDANFDQRGLN